nr:zinc finger, C6HC-type [Tanacetum cinerariifolium]
CRDRSLVPKEVLDRWDNALCESLIKGSEKFYCPFKDCSALLVDDGGEAVTSSECPHCNRLFCARCKVSWHAGMDCEEYQSLIEKGKIARSDSVDINFVTSVETSGMEVRRESKLDLRKGSSTQSLIRLTLNVVVKGKNNIMESRLDDNCMQIDDEEGGMKGESINEVGESSEDEEDVKQRKLHEL